MLGDKDNSVSNQTNGETNECADTSTNRATTSTDDRTDTSRRRCRASGDKQTVEPVQPVFDCVINADKVCGYASDNRRNTSTNRRTSRRSRTETQIGSRSSQSLCNGTIRKCGCYPTRNAFTQQRTAADSKNTSADNLCEILQIEFVQNSVNDTRPFESDTCHQQAYADCNGERVCQPVAFQLVYPSESVKNTLRDFPCRQTQCNRANGCQNMSQPSVKEITPTVDFISQTEPFLHFLNDFVYL